MDDRPGDAARRDAHPATRAGTIGRTVAGRYRLDQPQPSDLPGAERWDATDHILARPVTVTLLTGPRTGAAIDGARRAALVVDPRLARILDVGTADGTGYVVTEAVEGRTLAALTTRAPLPADQARAVIGEAATALEAARRRGVHHLALRPSVLRVTPAGRVVLDGLAVDGELLGTTGLSAHATSRADTIGLVRLLYGALTGRWPLVPETERASGGTLPTFAEWSARGADADATDGSSTAGSPDGIEAGLPLAPSTDSGPVPPGELVDAVPADLDTLCTVTLGPHDDGPHSPGELVRELEPWRAVRADAIYRAADAGRWAPIGGTTASATTGTGTAGTAGAAGTAGTTRRPAVGAAAGAAGAAGAVAAATLAAAAGSAQKGTPTSSPSTDATATNATAAIPTVEPEPTLAAPPTTEPTTEPEPVAQPAPEPVPEPVPEPEPTTQPEPAAELEPARTPTTAPSATSSQAPAAAPATGPVTAPVPATTVTGSTPEPPTDSTPDPRSTPAPGSVDPAPVSDGSRDAGTTTAPPTGSSPMTDDPQRSSTPDPDGTDASAEHTDHEAAAESTGVARQSVRSAFDQDDRPGARRPGTPPPATPAPASFPPASAPSTPTTPVRASTRSAAVPPSIPPTAAPGTPPATPAAAPAAAPATPPATPPARPVDPQPAATAASASVPDWDLPFAGEQPQRSTGQRRFDPTRWVLGLVALAVVVGVVVALSNVLAPWTSSSDDTADVSTPVSTASADPSSTPADDETAAADDDAGAATVAPQIASVSTIDPSDADGEHEELVGRLTDGDPSTAWYTHTYNRSDFAGFKDAVGLVVTLTEPATVTSVTLDVNGSGGNVEIRSTDAANPTTGDVLASGAMNGQTVFTLSQPTETQSIVLWFTSLSQTSDGANRIEISSLTVS